MKQEYVVINKSKIDRRIRVLEDEMAEHSNNSGEYYIRNFEKSILEDTLIDSTPLIPEKETRTDYATDDCLMKGKFVLDKEDIKAIVFSSFSAANVGTSFSDFLDEVIKHYSPKTEW